MVRIDHEVVINRPAEEVFAYLADPEKLPEWQPTVQEVRKETEGPVSVGTRMTDARRFLGRRIESTYEVTEHEPATRFALKVVSGPVPYEVRHELAPADGGTRVNVVLEGEPGGFFKLAEPLVARAVKRQLQSDFGTMKDLLEARA